MTRDRIQHALDIIYEKVFNLGQADLYPGLVSGPYLQHNPLFPNGLNAIVGYIKQGRAHTLRGQTSRHRRRSGFCTRALLDWEARKPGCEFRSTRTEIVEHWDVLQARPAPRTTPTRCSRIRAV